MTFLVANQVGSFLLMMLAWWLAHHSSAKGHHYAAALLAGCGFWSALFMIFRFSGNDLAVITVLSKYTYVLLFAELLRQAGRRP